MWKQLFNQIWNQRRANTWLWLELAMVTTLLWYGIDLVYNYEGAARLPKGYDTDGVFDLMVQTKPLEAIDGADNERAGEDFTYLYNLIKDYPGVEEVCAYYGSVPYTGESMFEGYAPHNDSTHVVKCYIRYVTPSYFKVFRLQPLAGQLDEEHWTPAEFPMPVLMSADLVDSLFHLPNRADAVGRTCFNPYWLNNKDNPVTSYRVTAVLPRHKLNDYERYEPFIYLPVSKALFWQHIALRVAPAHVSGFAERFRCDMQSVFDRGIFYLDYIRPYSDMKAQCIPMRVGYLLVSYPKASLRDSLAYGNGQQPYAGDALLSGRGVGAAVVGGSAGVDCRFQCSDGRPDCPYAGGCVMGKVLWMFPGSSGFAGVYHRAGYLVPRSSCHAHPARWSAAR